MALGGAMAKSRDDHQKDLLRPVLEAIIDLGHPLARLAREINWGFLDRRLPRGVRGGARSAGLAVAAGGGAVDLEAPARPVGRGALRALV
jgi:hypothetical protein